MSPIQERLLKMLEWFHKYCEQKGICYYAIGGTMIGAARHNGFIPWDDDVDIALPRADYMKLISQLKTVQDGYYLETPYSGNEDYLYSYAKLYDTNSLLIERTKVLCKRGIYIDVFPLDGIGDTLEEAQSNFKKIDRKNMFLMMRTCAIRKERSWYKNASIIMARLIPRFVLNDKMLSIELDKLAAKINIEASTYVANLMGTYRDREITKREYFGKPTLYTFESISIFGPEKYDEYLTGIYKDWRKLPPEDKRKTAHDYIILDLEKSYLNN